MSPPPRSALAEMPDVAGHSHHEPQGTLDWVGMSRIHQPIRLPTHGTHHALQSTVQIYVDLADPQSKGIHMSRLYLLLDAHARERPLTPASVKLLLGSIRQTHRDLSSAAYVRFEFDYSMRRPALKSDYAGWNAYPVSVTATLRDGLFELELGVDVLYSSTCPCSAALARQLIQQAFDQSFHDQPLSRAGVRAWLGTEAGVVATPHSQRSIAEVRVRLDAAVDHFPLEALIEAMETTLETPVQTAVKREDEQAFALRNGQNPMFCEDAARKLKQLLDDDSRFLDFHLRIEHQESLHAHDAVAAVVKGIPGGYRADPR